MSQASTDRTRESATDASDAVIAVVGAAGNTGSAIVQRLAARHRGPVRAVLHRPEREQAARAAGAAQFAVADLADPPSLKAAFSDATAVCVVPPVFHPAEDRLLANAAMAARDAGVERYVQLSVLHPATPGLPHHERKARGEAAIRREAPAWTILQPAMYAQTVLRLWRRSGTPAEFHAPYSLDAPFNVVDLADVAEVAAKVLVEPEHDYATYELAGPLRQTLGEMVACLGDVLGAPLDTTVVAPQDVVVPDGWSRSAAADLLAMYAHYDGHGLPGNPRALRWLLGREPATFGEVARRELSQRDARG